MSAATAKTGDAVNTRVVLISSDIFFSEKKNAGPFKKKLKI